MPQALESITLDHRGSGKPCHACAEFTPSDRLPSVGDCKVDGDKVLAQSPSCNSFRTFRAGGRTMFQRGGICAGID